MKISFITALSAYDLEDLIVEVLSEKDFLLLSRAHSKVQLFELVKGLPTDQRLLIIHDEILGLSNGDKKQLQTEQISTLELESDHQLNPEAFLLQVYERLRKPEKTELGLEGRKTRSINQIGDWIGVTGSSSAPGITTVAINLAAELSNFHLTTLVDGDSRRSDIGIRLGVKTPEYALQLSESLRLVNLDQKESQFLDKSLSRNFPNDPEIGSRVCVDLGSAPDLSVAVSDRRKTGQDFIEKLQLCRRLIYVVQPENHALNEMESFNLQLRDLYPEAQVTFVLNRSTTSSRNQAIKKSFRKKLEDMQVNQKHFIIPMDYTLVDRAQARFATISEVAPRSTLRKAYQELSIYLQKSF